MAVKGEGLVKRGVQVYQWDPQTIIVDHRENIRGCDGKLPDIPELMQFIRENGPLKIPPVHCRKNKEGKLKLVLGYRRMTAIQKLIEEGVEIPVVQVIVEDRKISDEEILATNISSNANIPLTPLELMEGYKRLENFGWSIQKIAQRTGRSEVHVRYILDLQYGSTETQNALANKDISVKTAVQIVRDNNTNEDQKAAIEQAKADKIAKKAENKAKREAAKAKKNEIAPGFVAPPSPVAVKQPKVDTTTQEKTELSGVIEFLQSEIDDFNPKQNREILQDQVGQLIDMLTEFSYQLDQTP